MELNYRQGEILDLLRQFRESSEPEKDVMVGQFECENQNELALKLIDMLLDVFEENLLRR